MNCTRACGYTLIELLVAITLAGLVAVMGAMVLRAGIDYQKRAALRLAESEHLRATDRLLTREWSRRAEQDLLAAQDQIEFRSDRMHGLGINGAAKVRYACTASESGEISLTRQVLAPGEAPQQGAASVASAAWRVVTTETLLPQLTACAFSYLRLSETRSGALVERVGAWTPQPATGQPAPRLLRLRIATARGEIAPLVYQVDG